MLVLLFAALSAQAAASSAPPPVTGAPSPSVAESERPICKRYADVGSNIARRKRCLTRAQWDQTARDAQSMRRSLEQSWTTPNQ